MANSNAREKPRLTVTCPGCRAKYQSPWKKLYTTMTCAKCGKDFTIITEDEPPLAPVDPLSAAPTVDASAAPTVELPSSDALTSMSPPVPHGDLAKPMALVALAVFGLAIVATQFPYGRIIGAVLAPIGLVIALLSLLGLEKHRWLGAVGAGLNAMVLVLVLVLPDWLRNSEWMPSNDPSSGPKPVTALGRDGSLPRPAEWVDASTAVWEQGDTRFIVSSVGMTTTSSPADKSNRPATKRKEMVLKIALRLTNSGVARAIEFRGWDAAPGTTVPVPTLTDADGTALPYLRVNDTGSTLPIYPGKSDDIELLFAPPTKPSKEYRLELPPQAFGGEAPVRFTLPRAMFVTVEADLKRPGEKR